MYSAIILYDADCGVCNRSVTWLIRRDRLGHLVFAGLSGATASSLRQRHPEIPHSAETLVLVKGIDGDEVVHLRARAVLGVVALLPWPWRALAVFDIFPSVLLDPPYRLFALLRNRLLPASSGSCTIEQNEAGRFLP